MSHAPWDVKDAALPRRAKVTMVWNIYSCYGLSWISLILKQRRLQNRNANAAAPAPRSGGLKLGGDRICRLAAPTQRAIPRRFARESPRYRWRYWARPSSGSEAFPSGMECPRNPSLLFASVGLCNRPRGELGLHQSEVISNGR